MKFRISLLLSALVLFLLVAADPAPHPSDWKDVEQALGRSGAALPGDVYKVSFPRSDLAVVADGVTVKPALALGSWIAFRESNGHAMAMGDLVLLESDVNPVIDILQGQSIEQSALHNHLIGETPHVMYVHFSGHGDAAKLAATLHAALAVTKTPMGPAAGRHLPLRRSTSPPRTSTASSAMPARRTAASISSASPARRRSPNTATKCRRRWERPRRSTSSPPAAGGRPSAETS